MMSIHKIYRSLGVNNVFKRQLNLSAVRLCTKTDNVRNETEKETHFGFKTVKESEKSQKVHEVFETVANRYDVMNDAMSFGIHRLWKDIFIERLSPTPNTKLLDVAGGTGDIAFRYINYLKNLSKTKNIDITGSHVTVCDINKHMLNVGEKRANDQKIEPEYVSWVEGDAENLPFEDDSFSAYTIAFGIRNVTHIDQALKEAYRVLVPGGNFMCLEFSHLENSTMQWLYDRYSFQMIPVMGQLIAGQWKPYQYLVESIRKFPKQDEFKSMIETAGFRCVRYENMTMGVVSLHSGFKI